MSYRKQIVILVSFAIVLALALGACQPNSGARHVGTMLATRSVSRSVGDSAHLRYLHWRHDVMRHQAFLKWISQLKRLSTSTNPISMSGSLYDQWSKVASCEEGGWVGSSGSAYPDSLGINATNWYANGGGSDVSPAAQIVVAERLIHRYGIGIPDQYACAAW